MLDIKKNNNATIKLTKPFMKGEDGGYYFPTYDKEGYLIWVASEEGMPVIAPFDVKGEDGGYYTPITDDNGELNWVPSNNKMPAVEGALLATKEYVDEALKDIDIPEGVSGVYVGVEEPTDESILWINPEGESDDLKQIILDTVDLSEYAKTADIPDTTGFITMPEVEDKGYQTEEDVRAIVAEGGGEVFTGAGMPSISAEVFEGSTGWTAVSITNQSTLISKLTKGAGSYYLITDTGSYRGDLRYGNPDKNVGIKITDFHLGSISSNLGITTDGSYSTGYNCIEIVYSTGDAGKEGLVPAPEAGSQNKKWLNSSGEWLTHAPYAASGEGAEAFNYENNLARGKYSHAEGYATEVNGDYAHAEGNDTTASGEASHAEGYFSSAVGRYSHVEGYGFSTNQGDASHVEGYRVVTNYALGLASHIEGFNNTSCRASGTGAHIEGYNNSFPDDTVPANGAHVEGGYNKGYAPYSHTQGKYAINVRHPGGQAREPEMAG